MRNFFLSIAFCLSPFLTFGQTNQPSSFYELTNAHIVIYGSTNVANFKCVLNQDNLKDTLRIRGIWDNDTITFEGLQLKFEVDQFDCGLMPLTKDFNELLQSDIYPHLLMEVKSIKIPKEPDLTNLSQLFSQVVLTIKQNSKTESITNCYLKESNKTVKLGGRHKIRLGEYRIKPPSKFMGMVEVNEVLDIEFQVQMKALPKKK